MFFQSLFLQQPIQDFWYPGSPVFFCCYCDTNRHWFCSVCITTKFKTLVSWHPSVNNEEKQTGTMKPLHLNVRSQGVFSLHTSFLSPHAEIHLEAATVPAVHTHINPHRLIRFQEMKRKLCCPSLLYKPSSLSLQFFKCFTYSRFDSSHKAVRA